MTDKSPIAESVVFPEIEDIVETYYPLAQELLHFTDYPMPAFAWHKKEGLEGAIGAAKNGYYRSLQECAANFGYYCIKNHPFRDGNKRMGVIILISFLLLNGFRYKRRRHLTTGAIIHLAEYIANSDSRHRLTVLRETVRWINRYFDFSETGPNQFWRLWNRLRLRR